MGMQETHKMPRRQPNFLSDEDEFYTGVGNRMEARVDSKSRGVAGELGFDGNMKFMPDHETQYPSASAHEGIHKHVGPPTKVRHHKPRGLAKDLLNMAHKDLAHIKHEYAAPSLMATEFHEARALLKELDEREKDDTSLVHIPHSLAFITVEAFNEESSEVAKKQLTYVNHKRAENEASGKPRRPRKDGNPPTTGPITIDKISKMEMKSPVNSGGGEYDIKVARNFLHKLIKKIPLLYYNLIRYSTHAVSGGTPSKTVHHTPARDEHQTKFYNAYHYNKKLLHKAKHAAHSHHGKDGGDGKRKKRNRKPREPRPSRA